MNRQLRQKVNTRPAMATSNDTTTPPAMVRIFDPFPGLVDTGAEEEIRLTLKSADVPVSDHVGKVSGCLKRDGCRMGSVME